MAKIAALLAAFVLLLDVGCSANSPTASSFDVTRYFNLTTNSTCGDPPTLFEDRSAPGVLLNCTAGEHDARFALDGDLNTRWQSANGDTPVSLTFSLQQPSQLAIELVAVNLRVSAGPPELFLLEVQPRDGGDFTLVQVYALDPQSGCPEYTAQGVPCSGYEGELGDIPPTVIVCPVNFAGPVSQFRFIAIGFASQQNTSSLQYRTLNEATIMGWVADGYYVRSLHHVSVEGEIGRRLDTTEVVQTATDEVLFPGFSFRGYAILQFSSSERVMVQWMFPSLPAASRYRLVLRYGNFAGSRTLGVMVMQGSQVYNARLALLDRCRPPCYATLNNVNASMINQAAEFELSEGPVTITMSLSSVDFALDSIIAIPEEFYAPNTLTHPGRFTQNCSVASGSLGRGTADETFCLESAVQLSAEFYGATFACSCQLPGSNGSVCDEYGGQCPCVTAAEGFTSITGRQCNLCPFVNYLTPLGCTACGCSNPLEGCNIATGQCPCPALVTGRTCDRCEVNSFGDPSVACMPCLCNTTGTDTCNQTTGECNCKPGVAGSLCDQCTEGTYNFSSNGCTLCECDSVGSVSGNCNDEGQCQCKPGVAGLKCSECLPGFYFLSDSGCLPCNCSRRTANCRQDPTSPSLPSELCSCPLPYTGNSCEGCVSGFFLSDATGNCEPCECNGRALTCIPGSGICLNCANNTMGINCELCREGFFDSGASFCLPCPCNTVTALNTSCNTDPSGSPTCFCRPGHEDSLCDSCSQGFFGQPPDFRCTRCDCNGNIDPAIAGSCDSSTGVCLRCINNSTGNECELCAPGFFGDATSQNCSPCDCLPDGSDTDLCDGTTGQCLCLLGVGGERCEQCTPGFWNFTAGVGCQPCDCSGGSTSNECNVDTGVCLCTVGVGGADCSFCLSGFFNFTSSGCTACECGAGAVNSSCTTTTGECYCQPGVVGTSCDRCNAFHTSLTAAGCEPCGECEQRLQTQLQTADSTLDIVMQDTDTFEMLSQADMQGFARVEAGVMEVAANISTTSDYLDMLENRLADLNTGASTFTATANNTSTRVNASLMHAADLQSYGSTVNMQVQAIYDDVRVALVEVDQLNLTVISVTAALQAQAIQVANIASNVAAVASEHSGNFSDALERAWDVLSWEMSTDVQSSLFLAQVQQNQAAEITADYVNITAMIASISTAINQTRQQHTDVVESLNQASSAAAQLARDVSTIENTIALASTSLNETEERIVSSQGALFMARDDIGTISSLLGQEGQSGLGPASGLGSASGLGNLQPLTVLEGISSLSLAVGALAGSVSRCADVVASAEQRAADLEQLAASIQSTLNASLNSGSSAVNVIIDYSNTITAINQALNLSSTTNSTIQSLLGNVTQLMVDQLQSQASSLLATSEGLLVMAQQVNSSVALLLPAVATAQSQVMLAENRSRDAAQQAISLGMEVERLRIAAESTTRDVAVRLSDIDRVLRFVNDSYDYVSSVVTPLLANVSGSQTELDNAQQMFTDADSALDSANSTASDALETTMQHSPIINRISLQSSANEMQLTDLNVSIGSLRQQLQEAMQAAASIDLALRFYGNSSLGYRVPAQAMDDTASVSLVFQPSDVAGGVMLHTSTTGGGALGLQLFNGSVQFDYDLERSESISSPNGSVQEDNWYQLYATREGGMSLLSVSSLQGGPTYTTMGSAVSLPPLSTSDIIYLGGMTNSTVVLSDGYVGCLDRVIVNNAQLSLLLPDDTNGELATCGPRPPAGISRVFETIETGAWLQGAGSFVLLSPPSSPTLPSSELQVQVAFRTLSPDGLLLQLFGVADIIQYLSLYLSGGQVVMVFVSSSLATPTRLETTGVYSNGNWYVITAELAGRNASLTVNMTEMQFGEVQGLVMNFNFSDQIYVGGLPPVTQAAIGSSPSSSLVSFAGCMRDLQVNGEVLDLLNNTASNRASFGGCPAEVAAGVRFMGDGMASFRPTPVSEQLTNISFAFRSTQLAALLIHVEAQPSPLSVSLYHTLVRVDLGDSSLVSPQAGLSNNQRHHVTIMLAAAGNDTNVTITVDGEVASALFPSPLPSLTASSLLVVGGTNDTSAVRVSERFRGCFDSLIVNGRAVEFSDALQLEGVSLYGCRLPAITTPLPPPPTPLPPPPSIRPNITIGLDGSSGSFLAYPIMEAQVVNSFSILLEFQTVSSDTLLLYTQGNSDYLALELRAGRLFYSYNLGSGRVYISSNGTYSDGLLHVVELRRTGRSGELVVDGGAESINGSSPGSFSALNIRSTVLFVGGTPTSMPPSSLLRPGEQAPPSALACFHALAINSRYVDLSMAQASLGSEECLDTYTNIASFNGTGYIQLLDNYYAGMRFAFSLEVRTRQCTGLLAYVASPLHPDHVLLEIVNKTIRFVFDNGPREVVVEYTPPSGFGMCDGQWHSLRVEKNRVTGTISLDGTVVASRTSAFPSFVAVNTNDPLFIGGVPDETRTRYTVENGPFEGCFNNFYLTREDGQMERVLFSQGSSITNVEFHTCRV